mmetsp:Transcript_4690/g.14170  ORF Transcript_4690/g.14170 Transcript_4690/m.14170 type:complete len:226 (-) Transcript_4690:1262-1939(-)
MARSTRSRSKLISTLRLFGASARLYSVRAALGANSGSFSIETSFATPLGTRASLARAGQSNALALHRAATPAAINLRSLQLRTSTSLGRSSSNCSVIAASLRSILAASFAIISADFTNRLTNCSAPGRKGSSRATTVVNTFSAGPFSATFMYVEVLVHISMRFSRISRAILGLRIILPTISCKLADSAKRRPFFSMKLRFRRMFAATAARSSSSILTGSRALKRS